MSAHPKWSRDLFLDEGDHESGEAGFTLTQFANALQTWSFMQQGRPTSVAEAASVFNTDAATVIEAVESHHWMFLTGPRDAYDRLMIEHDGE